MNNKRQEDLKKTQEEMMQSIEKTTNDPKELAKLLAFASKYNKQYSRHNRILLSLQGAKVVNSYKGWQDKGYNVKKGSSALKIYVPNTYKTFMKNGKKTSIRYATKEEKELIKSGKIKVTEKTFFRLAKCVFDVTQTDIPLEEIPKLYPNRHIDFKGLNDTEIEKINQVVLEVANEIGVSVTNDNETFIKFNGGVAKGFYISELKLIATNPDNIKSENVKTLVHELTHAILDTKNPNSVVKQLNIELKKESYSLGELQAELTAYLVTSYLGLEDENETEEYLAAWTKKGEKFKALNTEEKVTVMEDILKISDYLIEKIEER